MTTLDDFLRLPIGQRPPLIPDPYSLKLTDDQVREFQTILHDRSQRQWSFEEAKARSLEVLRLVLMLLDGEGYDYHLKNPALPPGAPMPPPPPDPLPTPQPFPIDLEADHQHETELALKMLADELRQVKRRPTHWRWALVALYNALGHTLAAHRPESFLPYGGLGQLTKLFEAVAKVHPEIAPAKKAVEEIDRLRTTWITRAVAAWPVDVNTLPPLFLDSLKLIRALEHPGVSDELELALGRLASQPD